MPHDPHRVVQVRGVHVHLAVEPRVVLPRRRDERGPPLLEGRSQLLPPNRVPLRREPLHGVVDHRVGEPRDELRGRRLERGTVRLREQPAVDLAPLRHPALEVLVAVLPVHELRVGGPRGRQQEPAELREGLVAVLGQWLEEVLPLPPKPAPLLVVPVPVSDPQVEEPRPQERAPVDPRLALEAPRPELARREDLDRTREARGAVLSGQGELLDRPRPAPERLAKLAERRVVGHEHVLRIRVQDGSGFGQGGDDEAVAGMVGGGRVLEEPRRHALRPLRGQDLRRVLVRGPERVALPVLSRERQPQALHPSDLPRRRQPGGEPREVQDGEVDRGHPLLPVARAHEQVVEGRRVVARPTGHHAARLGRGRRSGERRGGGQRQAERPGRATGHLSRSHGTGPLPRRRPSAARLVGDDPRREPRGASPDEPPSRPAGCSRAPRSGPR